MGQVVARSPGRRWALLAVLAVGVVAVAPGSAPTSASGSGTAVVPGVQAVASTFTPTPGGQAPCPEGLSRSTTVYTQGFEGGLPESRFAVGFARSPGGTAGSSAAKSYLGGSPGRTDHLFLPQRQVPVGAQTWLSFTARGVSQPSARAVVNSVGASYAPGPQWSGFSVDVSAATDDDAGWLQPWFDHRATGGRATSVELDQTELYRCRASATTRVAGADRYATAAALSAGVPAGAATVYIAEARAFPDSLSAAALAGGTGSPVLLVRTDGVPSATRTALTRLAPQRIVVLGGETVVSEDVRAALGAYAPTVERWGGEDRYETSALVSGQFAPRVDRAYVATGTDFADALSGGALAAAGDDPLLLVRRTGVPDVVARELTRLRPRQVVVLGGTSAVSASTMDALARYASGTTPVRRIEGADRYAVSAAVAAEFGTPTQTFLATGTDFADAVSGSALAGSLDAPVLLTRPTGLPAVVDTRLRAIGERRGTLIGGPASVASIVRDQYGRTLP